MNFKGFNQKDFDTFTIEGLEERMKAIQERIQPKFRIIGEALTSELSVKTGNEMFLHIAKHARRTVNPPKDTWLAIAANKRGYKQHPHFQIGLFDDHVFIWLAYIYELPQKEEYAKIFLENLNQIKAAIPNHYMISFNHMQKDAKKVAETDLQQTLERFRNVKKAEFLIGQHIQASDPILENGDQFMALAEQTFETLLPLYQLSLNSR
ncbi:YktB family protein [Niallia nealsonii]|uniref:UPF0637 protein CWS01_18665 n=1 Tax=Niallia nealsonii TaxID=115979 RepID=A0A2N0YY30_9BACI|nr:DUF1054 domain-containing protein [Niallia nealsonii]PKG22167.1 DUF1054 domain-containing protein [Niallia nealsonii]